MTHSKPALRRVALLAALSTATIFGAATHAAPQASTPAAVGIDVAGMDPSVAPGDDFFRYANGTWDRTTPIPADRSSWGLDAGLAETAALRTRTLLEGAEKSAAAGSDARKAGDYYAAYMDETAIEALGVSPLQPELDRIARIADRTQLAAAIGSGLRNDVDPLNATIMHTDRLFGLFIAQDFNEPSRNTAYLLQGGIGLPDREYYLADNAHMSTLREQYRSARRERAEAREDSGRRREGGADFRAGDEDREGARRAARILRTFTRRTTRGRAPSSAPRRRVSTGAPSSRPRASTRSRS